MDSSKHDHLKSCPLVNKEPDTDETDKKCQWWINSPKHNNCFWQYVKDKSAIDGSMPEMSQSEIAHLMGWSNTKTHFTLKQAMVDLETAFRKFNANQLILEDKNSGVNPTYLNIEPVTNYSSDDSEE